jgi:riboflavin synthase
MLFTGLVEATGCVVSVEEGGMTRIVVLAANFAKDTKVGDSISVNGVCLTVNEKYADVLVFYAMTETLRRTALGELREGSAVNLERAMAMGARFGGHIVQGHVDGVGEVTSIAPEGDAEIWEFEAPESVLRYAIEKGSVCVNGISLTIISVKESSFTVSILPQTKEVTNLRNLVLRDRVNLEADIIGKYVERLLRPRLDEKLQISERSVGDAV